MAQHAHTMAGVAWSNVPVQGEGSYRVSHVTRHQSQHGAAQTPRVRGVWELHADSFTLTNHSVIRKPRCKDGMIMIRPTTTPLLVPAVRISTRASLARSASGPYAEATAYLSMCWRQPAGAQLCTLSLCRLQGAQLTLTLMTPVMRPCGARAIPNCSDSE